LSEKLLILSYFRDVQEETIRMRIVTRPDFLHVPEIALPVYVRSVGNYQLPPRYEAPPNPKQGYVEVFWCVRGSVELELDKTNYSLSSGQVLWKKPAEQRWRYCCGAEGLELRWFTMEGPMAGAFMAGYEYPRLIDQAGTCPHHLFGVLEDNLHTINPYTTRHLISVATEILAMLGAPREEDSRADRMVRQFIERAQAHLGDATVNVNALADMIGVHRSTLSRIFKAKMLLSPGEYLLRLRLQHALALLQGSQLSMREVGRCSGFPVPSYFCRAIKQATGLSPRQFRAQNLGG
jgi:AraC-like DNA-binding protein